MSKKSASKTPATFNPATNPADNELATLAQALLQSKAKAAPRPQPIICPAELHKAIVAISKGESALVKAENQRFQSVRALIELAVPAMTQPIREAVLVDIKAVFEAAKMKPMGIYVAGILNSAFYLVHGKAKSKDMPSAIPAQGVKALEDILNACKGLKALKSALTAANKPELAAKHAASGVPQHKPAKEAASPVKTASGATGETPVQVALRMLRDLPNIVNLKPGTDAALIGEIEAVYAKLESRLAA